MEWLNFHHLLYFRVVAREGSIAAAAKTLRLSRSTVSAQLRVLEQTLGRSLFRTTPRGLLLTPFGEQVAGYAAEIEALGNGVLRLAKGEQLFPQRSIGVASSLPAAVLARILAKTNGQSMLRCRSADNLQLFEWVRDERVEAAFTSERPAASMELRSRRVLSSEVALFAVAAMAKRFRKKFPSQLHAAPMVLPGENTVFGASVRRWFEHERIEYKTAAVVDDLELMRTLGAEGLGVFPVRTAFAHDVEKTYRVERVGLLKGLVEHCYLCTRKNHGRALEQQLLDALVPAS